MKYYTMNSETQYKIVIGEDGNLLQGEPILDKDGNPIVVEYIKRDSDKALIPCTEENKDYVVYLADEDKEVLPFDYEAETIRNDIATEAKKVENYKENLIQGKIRAMAIKELEDDGKIV